MSSVTLVADRSFYTMQNEIREWCINTYDITPIISISFGHHFIVFKTANDALKFLEFWKHIGTITFSNDMNKLYLTGSSNDTPYPGMWHWITFSYYRYVDLVTENNVADWCIETYGKPLAHNDNLVNIDGIWRWSGSTFYFKNEEDLNWFIMRWV